MKETSERSPGFLYLLLAIARPWESRRRLVSAASKLMYLMLTKRNPIVWSE
jgi:hypothetical protein